MTMLALPRSLDQIDAEWMTQALSQLYPGTVVTSCIHASSVRATGTKLRLVIDYNDAGHAHRLPPTMWYKSGLEAHSDNIRDSHVRESLFYSEIAPLGLLNVPACYFTGTDESGISGQLLEDLLARNARFGAAIKPVAPDVAAQALTMLARLHAHAWMSADLERLGTPGGTLISDGIVLRLLTPEAWGMAMTKPAAANLPAPLRDIATVRDAMQRLWAFDMASNQRCMVHGDAHTGNMFFEQDGRPGFLDFQRFMQCDWAHDVNYFLVSAMAVDDVAAHEARLLEHYLKALHAAGGPDLDRADAGYRFRLHTMYGLIWNVVPPTMQTEETVSTIASRFNAAAVRHDLAGLMNL
jgi:hypothetical protein